jgi:chromosome segregation ATPase
MASITNQNAIDARPAGEVGPFVSTRFDAPHLVPGTQSEPSGESHSSSAVAPVASPGSFSARDDADDDLGTILDDWATRFSDNGSGVDQQVRLQASQLAEILQTKQRDLDQREATLNAALSQLDKQSRAQRLQLREREEELNQRSATLDARSKELEARIADLNAAEMSMSNDQAAVESHIQSWRIESAEQRRVTEQRMHELAQRESELAAQRQSFARLVDETYAQLDEQRQELEATRQRQDREFAELVANLKNDRRQFEVRCREESESVASRVYAELAAEWEALRAEQAEFRNRVDRFDGCEGLLKESWDACERQRRELEAKQRKFDEELQERKRLLDLERRQLEDVQQQADLRTRTQEESLAKRAAAVEQTRADLVRVHQETLEIRLVLEQLWGQLGDRLGAAELSRAVAAGRARLADEYRLAGQSLAEQRKEVDEVAQRLTEQQSRLRRQRTEIQEWLARRNQDLHERETRIAVREERLGRADQAVADLHRQLEQERFAAQKRLAELSAQLGRRIVAEEKSSPYG